MEAHSQRWSVAQGVRSRGVAVKRRKFEALRGKKNFDRLFHRGTPVDGRILRCLVLWDTQIEPSSNPDVSIGIAISRTMKRAVDRNRIRRLIRESYRRHIETLDSCVGQSTHPLALVFIYSSKKQTTEWRPPTFQDIEKDVVWLLSRVNEHFIRKVQWS